MFDPSKTPPARNDRFEFTVESQALFDVLVNLTSWAGAALVVCLFAEILIKGPF